MINNDLDLFFADYFINELDSGWMNDRTRLEDIETEICETFVYEPLYTMCGNYSQDCEKLVQERYGDQFDAAREFGYDAMGSDFDEHDINQVLSMAAYESAQRLVGASDTLRGLNWGEKREKLTEEVATQLMDELEQEIDEVR